MGKINKGKLWFTFFHFFFILAFIAIAVIGMVLIERVFLGIGFAVILIGVVSFFFGHQFITGIYDKYGNEYYATNIRYKLLLLLSFIVVGAAVAELPKYFEQAESVLIGIILALFGIIVGVRMNNENYEWYNEHYYLRAFTASIGRIVPVAYIFGAGIYALFWETIPFLASAIIVLCAIFHFVRVICVYQDRPF
jgi:hypothetical protein